MELRTPGHGTTCEADHENPDFGKCGEPACAIVNFQGQDRAVCKDHLKRLPVEITETEVP